jgi:hypothetical protein
MRAQRAGGIRAHQAVWCACTFGVWGTDPQHGISVQTTGRLVRWRGRLAHPKPIHTTDVCRPRTRHHTRARNSWHTRAVWRPVEA